MPTAVVTGGAGFLGSHLCDYLIERDFRVICVDNLDTGSLQKVGRHQYLVVVLAARSMAGKSVNVTRWVPGRGWVTFRTAPLTKLERTPTTSVAYVTAFVRPGAKLRIFMPQSQVGADYLDGHSNFVVN